MVAPLLASFLPALWGDRSAIGGAEFVTVGLFAAAFAVPFTLAGLLLIGWPLTYFGERCRAGQAWPIVALNGAVAALGFVLAFLAEWPMIDLQRMVWLTLAFSALVFTLIYLRGPKQRQMSVRA